MFRPNSGLAVLTSLFLAAPVAAQPADDDFAASPAMVQTAKDAFATGRAGGVRPQTRGEYLTCAGHWQALHQLQKGAAILLGELEPIDPALEAADAKAMSNRFLDKYGEQIDEPEHWERFESASSKAIKNLAGFKDGDAQGTKTFFEMLGMCSEKIEETIYVEPAGDGDGKAAVHSDGGPLYTDPLPDTPEAITRAFFDDHTAWNSFAEDSYRETKDFGPAQSAYRRLVDLYCGPEKQHQGLAFGTDPSFDAPRSQILGSNDGGDVYIVKMRHTGINEFVADHEFVFVRREGRWWLEEIYYLDEYAGKKWPGI